MVHFVTSFNPVGNFGPCPSITLGDALLFKSPILLNVKQNVIEVRLLISKICPMLDLKTAPSLHP